jgi:hypothetical protein
MMVLDFKWGAWRRGRDAARNVSVMIIPNRRYKASP